MEQPAEATEVLETLSREEQIEALPSLRAVTGAKGDVEQYTSILLWALRSTPSKDAVFDECTPAEKVDMRVAVAWGLIKCAIEAGNEGVDIHSAVPKGRAGLIAHRSRNFKLGFDGTLGLDVSANYDEYVCKRLKPIFGLLISPDEIESFDYEVPIPRGIFVAGVLEQLLVQFGVYAAPRFDFAYRASTVYAFSVDSESHRARVEKAGGITLGKVGTFAFKPATSRVTFEEFFVLGTTGIGSARADLRPAVAGALKCSRNEVKTLEEQEVKRAFKVIKCVYPYTMARYDLVTRLFTQGRFQLVNPRVEKSKPLEIFVAPTLIELGHLSGVQIVKNPQIMQDIEEDEENVAVDLTPPRLE